MTDTPNDGRQWTDGGKPIWYRLAFTKDDDLDLTQVYFGVAVVFSFIAFAKVGRGDWSVTGAAWAFLGSVFATLAITGTPRWVAELLAKSKLPGEVAAGIGEAVSDYGVEPLTRRVDDPDRA